MFRRIGTRIAVTAPALVAAACEGEPGTPPEPPHRTWDSAGVTIVENPRPASGSRLRWQIGAEPVLSIGSVGADDRFQFHRVDDALRLRDGRIVVANAGSHQLLVFDEAGEYLTAWGRKGEGPGEFAGEWGGNDLGWRLFWAEPWRADSIAVCHGTYSLGLELFSVFDSRGTYARTVNLARGHDRAARRPHDVCADVLPGGGILAIHRDSRPAHRVTRLNRPDLEFLVLDADGSLRVSLGTHPGAETFNYWEDHYSSFWLDRPPFKQTVVWAAWGPLTIVSPTDHYEIRAYDADGSLARIVRRDHDARTPTQADLDAYRDRYLGRPVSDPEISKLLTRVMDAVPLPASFPAFSAIEVDRLDYLWVREYNLPGEEDRALWTVFDPEGVAQGFIETPAGLEVFEIGEDYILGKVRDELRVEYVQVWALERSG
ncbi:MAG: 6-bladed beta-propeller [Gemmatimonadota bacterium]|nr:6-bladed beta-propeller [Gemmatimonadota bacterium]MDE2872467.1 6-bladed beta-propeller [Gemmatimonadota bacterium]